MAYIRKNYKVLLCLVLFILGGLACLYYITTPTKPLSVRVWKSASRPLMENSTLEIAENDQLEVVYEHIHGANSIGLRRVSKHTVVWERALATSDVPLTYSVSYDGDNLSLIHLWVCWESYKKEPERANYSSDDGFQQITFLPHSPFSQLIPVCKLKPIRGFISGPLYAVAVCTAGDVVDTFVDPLLFNVMHCDTLLTEHEDEDNGASTLLTIKKTNSDDRYHVHVSGIHQNDIVGVHRNACKEIIVLAKVNRTTVLPENITIQTPQELGFQEYYIAILVFAQCGTIRWWSLAGPFVLGSAGVISSYVAEDGTIFLVGLSGKRVEYWKDNTLRHAIEAKGLRIYDIFYGLDHGQALLVLDRDGQLLFSGRIADGFFVPPYFMHPMRDNTLGLYARVGWGARLLDQGKIHMIHEKYPLPSAYVFLEIPHQW